MKALVIQCSSHPRLAEALDALSRGVAKNGAEVVRTTPADNPIPDGFDAVFVGFHVPLFALSRNVLPVFARGNWNNTVVGLVATHTGYGQNPLARVEQLAVQLGARAVHTLHLKLAGLQRFIGRGKLSETQSVRAEAFGERVTRLATGRAAPKSQDKARIQGYRKARSLTPSTGVRTPALNSTTSPSVPPSNTRSAPPSTPPATNA